jgi:hypothetical protein
MVQFKQKCSRCKVNYMVVTSRTPYGAICYDCQKKELEGEITDPEMKKMFDVPEQFYKDSSFLRSIKVNYLRYGKLSEKQVDAFKIAVEKMKAAKK